MVNLNVLGIDIGSVAVCIVESDFEKNIVKSSYIFHKGDVSAVLKEEMNQYDFGRISHIAVTSSTPDIIKYDGRYNNQVAVISAAKQLHGKFKAILSVGGEKFGLLLFDEKGSYQSFKSNTSCAAGTGSFLDQQAGRLNLEDIASLSRIAHSNTKGFPKIASRCAVFAKTDLIHAQQEGYSLGEISEGLCAGLAKNIVDTLFNETKNHEKIIFCGGVSKNTAVKKHLASMTGANIVVDELSHLYGAVGAAFCQIDELVDAQDVSSSQSLNPSDILKEKKTSKKLFYPALELNLSDYPDFNSLQKYNYYSQQTQNSNFVEVDVYEDLPNNQPDKKKLNVWIGVDIGSTSTKAVLLGEKQVVLAGFYTRTAGAPLKAMCLILESIHDLVLKNNTDLIVNGCGTTGSGRKFIGKIIGADTIVDEITAHARAACEINSAVDTIIEIGGQDAKFTTLKNGAVTSSTMNNVCAAGTGSFIEEQASKLGCSISDYSNRTENVKAPMSSDRCTVFMERDLNHYLTEGYAVNEVLASVLHSVRENYLLKVATQSNIGNFILFQGATAKNRALVAAFEQRLQKPIMVSKFCHLTGALGTALTLVDENVNNSLFRGIDIYKKEIPVISEVCDICTNSCKISVAQINGEKVAYGFLCGRDYDTQQYVNNKISGFDLLKERKKIESSLVTANGLAFAKAQNNAKTGNNDFTIGIPAALHLFEDMSFWKYFFDSVGVKTVTSSNYKGAVKRGKNLSETEFCAPATAMYGHVEYLMGISDFIFLPYYLENKSKTGRRQFCYYTQYLPTIMAKYNREKILRPLVKFLYTNFYTKLELYKMLKSIGADISFFDISSAYDKACDFKQACEDQLNLAYTNEIENTNDVSVVFLGRPYTILSSEMNSGIPGIFSSLGIKTFYQDMVSYSKEDTQAISPLLSDIHWNYPAAILNAAEKIAKTPDVYPVFITSFKCTPDSFGLKYFKELMDKHEKPYLILELDEHDSSVGYETRIEAAIRSFRNDSLLFNKDRKIKKETKNIDYSSLFLNPENNIKGKNLVFPNWDNTTCRLLLATLKQEGINAYLIEETDATILKSMKFNTGQCIPVNAIAQGFVETIEKNNLDPANTLLWVSKANFCNLKLYPNFIKTLLKSYGNNMDQAQIFIGELTFIDISMRASMNAYFSHMFGGMLTKMGCQTRPYEIEKGMTDQVIEKSITILEDAFLGNRSKEEAVSQIVSRFEWIEVDKRSPRPRVAIFGDMYVRDNAIMNQHLISYIEENGGEVITTPYTEIGKMIAPMYYRKWFNEGLYSSIIKVKAIVKTMGILEKKYYKYFERVLKQPQQVYDEAPEQILSQYNIINENIGESMENTLKIHYLAKHYPDLTLFIQTNPAFCCPSMVTEAMKKEIEKITSIPVVSITYDGTGGLKNESVVPYLKFPRNLDKQRFRGDVKVGEVVDERKETEFTLICL